MSQWLKQGSYIGGTPYINNQSDSTDTAATDVFGLNSSFGGGLVAGSYLQLNDSEAKGFSLTSIGTLFRGIYQRVRLSASASALKYGNLLFWDTTANVNQYQVTNIEGAPNLTAGIYLGAATGNAGALAPGNWGWIQVAGRASVFFTAGLNNGVPLAGDSVYQALKGAGANNAAADDLVIATTFAPSLQARFLGVAVTAPASNTVSLVDLRNIFPVNI